MLIKRTLLFFILLVSGFISRAQNLPVVNLVVSNHRASIRSLDLPLKNAADLSIDLKGNLIINAPDQVNITYYDQFDGEAKQGKMKTINGTLINYYDKFDGFDNIGKLKSVGTIQIGYYDRFDNKIQLGKLKTIGNTNITYYDQFDGLDNAGKIKSIGKINVVYYDRFDADLNGKIKSVGNTQLMYYDRFSDAAYVGKVKSVNGDTPDVHIYNVASSGFQEDK